MALYSGASYFKPLFSLVVMWKLTFSLPLYSCHLFQSEGDSPPLFLMLALLVMPSSSSILLSLLNITILLVILLHCASLGCSFVRNLISHAVPPV